MDVLYEIGKTFGPTVMLAAFLLWMLSGLMTKIMKEAVDREGRMAKEALERENRMAGRLDTVQDEFTKCRREVIDRATETNTQLIAVVEKNTAAVERNTQVLNRHLKIEL